MKSEKSRMRRAVVGIFASTCLFVPAQGCTGSIDPTPIGIGDDDGAAGAALGDATPSTAQDSTTRVLRRLNRTEYNNTVRDLLGTSSRPADKLPDDETVAGFDTVGEGLSLSLQHLEVFEQAATQLVDELYALSPTDERRTAVLVCEPQAGSEASCARQILASFARRAFRRPATDEEVAGWLELAERVRSSGNGYEEGLKAALRSILLSPHFLYMVEKPAAGTGAVVPLNDHELATRLSYFLWSTMPDATLFAAAEAGTLSGDSTTLAAEAERMLEDPKAEALTRNFVGQWLTLRRLALVEPDQNTFPAYDVSLRDAAVRETELFVGELITENAPIETLLTADFSFVNQRLGEHYGVSTSGLEFERVSLGATPRVGILGQTSFLMATSHPAFTSPTKRGAWVLEQLLCDPPPPPPPDLVIEPLGAPAENQTVREKLEAHRSNPSCNACHGLMDPIGFGLENFDSIGAYHATQNGQPVDATGEWQGMTFSGVQELAALISQDPRLAGCFATELLTYAVGRPFHTVADRSYADALVQDASTAGRRGVRDVIKAVALSDAFRTHAGK